MTKIASIICSLAFLMSGVMMALTASDPSPGTGYKTITASTLPKVHPVVFPTTAMDTCVIDIPEDLVRDLAKRKGVLDTVYITKTDTIKERVTKVKWRKAPAPKPVVIRDTIREAHYYLATQSGMKEGPDGQCIPIYEVHKVNEICPNNDNSSVKSMIESNDSVVD